MGKLKKIILNLHYLIILLVGPFSTSWALDITNIFQNDFLQAEKILYHYAIVEPSKSINLNKELSIVKKILSDPEGRIKPEFKISPFFLPNVQFWFGIYSQFPSHQIVIHDKNNLSLIYDVFDFNELKKAPLNPYLKAHLQSQFAKDKVMAIKRSLQVLAEDVNSKTPASVKFLKILKKNNISIPVNPANRKDFFQTLSDNLRVQTGQQDMIFQGILNSLPFLTFIKELQTTFELPEELLAVAFLESSFNIHARSRVGAAGLWQFIPYTANQILPMEKKSVDGRLGPLLPTIGAFHLLKQNYKILNRWDLSVTAYNSGTKHLLLAKKQLGEKEPSLENIFLNYQHPHLGFASKNFYAEFLALVHVLAYKEHLFPYSGVNFRSSASVFGDENKSFKVYVSLCNFVPEKLYRSLEKKGIEMPLLNKHLLKPAKTYKRGTVIISRQDLSSKKFYLLSLNELRRNFPKNFYKLIKSQSCSTK